MLVPMVCQLLMANRHRVDSEIYKVGIPNQKFLCHRTKKICFLEKYLNFYPAKVCQLHSCAGSKHHHPSSPSQTIVFSHHPHKDGMGTLWPNLNRLSRLVPCGKRGFYFYSRARNSLDFKFVFVPSVPPDSVAPTLHCKNGRGNTFFTERRHS